MLFHNKNCCSVYYSGVIYIYIQVTLDSIFLLKCNLHIVSMEGGTRALGEAWMPPRR